MPKFDDARCIGAVLVLALSTGCANVSTTRFVYTDPQGASVTVEMPKELDAKNLEVKIDSKKGIAVVKADLISTRNVETIHAQANRESQIAGKVAEGVTKGAVKGLKSF